MSSVHEKYVHQVIYWIGSRGDSRAFKRDNGTAHAYSDRFKKPDQRHIIRYGVIGEADVGGFTLVCGLPIIFGIEIKIGPHNQSKVQKDYEIMIKNFNGIYLIHKGGVDSKEKLLQDFEDARNKCRDKAYRFWVSRNSTPWRKQ